MGMSDTKALVEQVREALAIDPETATAAMLRRETDALVALSELEARMEALRLMQDDKLIARVAELEEALEAAEALLAAEGLYEAEGGRQREVDALRQALAALGDWPKAGYDTPMFGGKP